MSKENPLQYIAEAEKHPPKGVTTVICWVGIRIINELRELNLHLRRGDFK